MIYWFGLDSLAPTVTLTSLIKNHHRCALSVTARDAKLCLYLKPAQKGEKPQYWSSPYTIRTKSQCDTPNVIYVISCKRCGIQYVGETNTKLCLLFANHVSSVKTKNPTLWLSILTTPNHTINDVEIIVIETCTSNDTHRKLRKSHWIHQTENT